MPCVPIKLIQESIWMARAWTYQEALLSTRRLIFTEEQLYFECQGYYCTEPLSVSSAWLSSMHREDLRLLDSGVNGPGKVMMFPEDRCGTVEWHIFTRINEYTRRKHSHDEDILNGILGIMKTFERKFALRHLWGLPFSVHKSEWAIQFGRMGHVFCSGLQWRLKRPSRRRVGFPSWSWTGWYGEVHWLTPDSGRNLPRKDLDYRLGLQAELASGENIYPFEIERHSIRSAELTRFIHLTCLVFPVTYQKIDGSGGVQYCITYHGIEDEKQSQRAERIVQWTTKDMPLENAELLAIYVPGIIEGGNLILQNMGKWWERVATTAIARLPAKQVWRTLRLG
ncbi:hypothetical protein BDV95DRAFT_278738 [Massariosphaeria phaeospora]|uniref:Heterokaryon incompatibility domain-containing protein n=1 Tax=Massariosphaeria phaeospora TaxID=100035 RepID=A0A7C8IF44_9PLEO|nr:hypothetical protein BDV95DRAFT_278738 [Massariosphaeria phaeospora]